MRRLLALLAAATLSATGVGALGGAAAAAPAPPDPNKRALVVGISQYEPPTRPTFGGAGDAESVKSALLKNGWAEDNIVMLVDGAATADAIRKGLDWLVRSSNANTESVFHYSGHTKQERSGMADGDAEEYDEFIWSALNEFIADGELSDRLQDLQGKSVISIAACEAAGFDDGISSPNRMVLSASREDQKAYEYAGAARSVFVNLLFDQALLAGAGDTDGNKAVSLQEAYKYAAAIAPKETANQQPYGPQDPVMAGGDGSQWFLSPPAAASGGLGALIPKDVMALLPKELRGLLVPQTP
ncbi:MAG: caspase family protein [Actinomycetota bacterium]|nr:caspase family protein [Actinomycetota bacterium]